MDLDRGLSACEAVRCLPLSVPCSSRSCHRVKAIQWLWNSLKVGARLNAPARLNLRASEQATSCSTRWCDCLTSLFSPHLTSPHLISPHPTGPHLPRTVLRLQRSSLTVSPSSRFTGCFYRHLRADGRNGSANYQPRTLVRFLQRRDTDTVLLYLAIRQSFQPVLRPNQVTEQSSGPSTPAFLVSPRKLSTTVISPSETPNRRRSRRRSGLDCQ